MHKILLNKLSIRFVIFRLRYIKILHKMQQHSKLTKKKKTVYSEIL